MIVSLIMVAVSLPVPPAFNDTPPPKYVVVTTTFRCGSQERSIAVRTLGGREEIVGIHTGNKELAPLVWKDIRRRLASFSSVGAPQPVCSARGDTFYLTGYRGAETTTLTLTFTATSATLAESR